ncbi:MAG: glutathione-disulfide reductase [Pseudomonadota bacterium]
MQHFDFDLFIIGAGSGGTRAARIAAQNGFKVGLAETRHLGGTCVNVGCIPKKLFSYAAHFNSDIEDAKGYGWNFKDKYFDWQTLCKNTKNEIKRLNGVYAQLLDQAGVHLFKGHASLKDRYHIIINDEQNNQHAISAKNILIATGGQPVRPSIKGHQYADISDSMFDMPHLPKRIAIIGGGYIAVEFASIFKGLGCEVSLLYRKDLFLRGFDDDLRYQLSQEMQRNNIDLRFLCNVEAIEKQSDGLHLKLNDGSQLLVDRVLYAIGRKANLINLGLEKAGVELNAKGAIQVNNHFQTNIENIYALGDVIGRVQLTPVAISEAMVFIDNLIHNTQNSLDYNDIATAVFSHPNMATVGLNEAEARKKYDHIDVYKSHFKPLRNTLANNEERVLIKLVVEKKTNKIVGAHMMGPDAGEIIQALAIAIKMGVKKSDLDATMAIHPTIAEELVTLR